MVPINGLDFNQVWTVKVFLARNGSGCLSEGKGFYSDLDYLGIFGLKWFRLPRLREKV